MAQIVKLCTGAKAMHIFQHFYKMRTGAIQRWFFDDVGLQPDFPGGHEQDLRVLGL